METVAWIYIITNAHHTTVYIGATTDARLKDTSAKQGIFLLRYTAADKFARAFHRAACAQDAF